MKAVIFVISICLSLSGLGQIGDVDSVDRNQNNLSYHELLEFVAQNFLDEKDIAEYFYHWVAQNVTYDYGLAERLAGKRDFPGQDALNVFESKKAVCSGYAILYKLLLNEFEIECEIVNGYAKSKEGLLTTNDLAISHSWNVIKLDDKWHLVDVTWASTMMVDDRVSSFHFMTPPEFFINNHLPKFTFWQLLDEPFTKEEFVQLPEVNAGYYDLGFDSKLPELTCDEVQCKLKIGASDEWKPVINLSTTGLDYQSIDFTKKNSGDIQELTFQSRHSEPFILRLDAYRPIDWKSEIVRTRLAYVVVME